MTNDEIIKALEDVIKWFTDHGRGTNTAVIEIAENAINLINRLQEKNKEFDEKIVMQRGLIDWQKAEIERLNRLNSGLDMAAKQFKEELDTMKEKRFALGKEAIQLIKSEAIKEFAEKLPELIPNFNGETTMEVVERAIQQLVKEMTEG